MFKCNSSSDLQELGSFNSEIIICKNIDFEQEDGAELFTTIIPVCNSLSFEDTFGQFKLNISCDMHYLYQIAKQTEYLENQEDEIQNGLKTLWVKQQTLLEQILE
ncbi:Hypothetical_protein [Hexamita inflata]|uniref:Hypothetical_protein n=1 Tax=Hexamita inflata TaxID=28002 RepID=A0AA86TM14_9EUKA|nr:Hypothetical protein HINF_LOCUS10349 [Hexamita inflata]